MSTAHEVPCDLVLILFVHVSARTAVAFFSWLCSATMGSQLEEGQALLAQSVARADGLRYQIGIRDTELLEVKSTVMKLRIAAFDAAEAAAEAAAGVERGIVRLKAQAETSKKAAKTLAANREAKLQERLAEAHATVVSEARGRVLERDRALDFESRLGQERAHNRWSASQLPELDRLRAQVLTLTQDNANLVRVVIDLGGRLR
jgi:hypothetical protein